jgi:hypothetical protein
VDTGLVGPLLSHPARAAAAAASTLTDNFDAASLDTAKWYRANISGAAATSQITQAAGTLNISADGTVAAPYNAIARSVNKFDIRGSSVFAKIVSHVVTNASDWGYWQTGFRVYGSNANQGFGFVIDSKPAVINVRAYSGLYPIATGESYTTIGTTIPYDPATHAWFRLREAAGTLYFDTAPSTASNPPIEADWVNQGTYDRGLLNANFGAYCHVEFFSGFWSAATAADFVSPAQFDGLNIRTTPSTATNYTSVADPATFSMSVTTEAEALGTASSAAPATFTMSANIAASSRQYAPSNALPATFVMTANASAEYFNLASIASAAAFAMTANATTDSTQRASAGLPATYLMTANAATSNVQRVSSADPASFAMTAFATDTDLTLLEGESPAAFTMSAFPATGNINRVSVALPAEFSMTVTDAGEAYSIGSIASPAVFAMDVAPTTETVGVAYTSDAQPAVFTMSLNNATSNVDYTSAAAPAEFAMDVPDATSIANVAIVSIANPAVFEMVTFDAAANAGKVYISIAGAAEFAMVAGDTRDLQALSSSADSAIFFMQPKPATSFEGEQVAEGTAGIITRTIIKREAVPGPRKPSAEAILAAQRAGIDTTALGAPPSPPAPVIIIPAPVPAAPQVTPPAPGSSFALPGPVPADNAAQPERAQPIPNALPPLSDAQLQIANRTLSTLTRALAERDSQIAELKNAVGAAFVAGMVAAEE